MIYKIITGAQMGVERAALDVALNLKLAYAGWVAKGGVPDKGGLPKGYNLSELGTSNVHASIEKNMDNADGVLLLSNGPLNDIGAMANEMAQNNNKPCLHVDLKQQFAFQAAQLINDWLNQNEVRALYITGDSQDPIIYQETTDILETVIILNMVPASPPRRQQAKIENQTPPVTVNDAVLRLIKELKLKDKAIIANMTDKELVSLEARLGQFIRKNYELDQSESPLVKSCQFVAKKIDLTEYDAMRIIIRELWFQLRQTHTLRVIK